MIGTTRTRCGSEIPNTATLKDSTREGAALLAADATGSRREGTRARSGLESVGRTWQRGRADTTSQTEPMRPLAHGCVVVTVTEASRAQSEMACVFGTQRRTEGMPHYHD